MHCNYTNLEDYLKWGREHPEKTDLPHKRFRQNSRLWKYCSKEGRQRSSYCWTPHFLNKFCSLFPFQAFKTVRLRVNLTRELVEDLR